MPSIISHAAVATAAGIAFAPQDVPTRFWPLAIACSVIPDADVAAFSFGIPYHHYLGHRGFFHSLCFALILSFVVTGVFFRAEKLFSARWFFYITFFFLLTASHGVLDAFTNGGLGIALFSPFSNERYFFPWTPIAVSPISIGAFLSQRGWFVLKSEFLWVWFPASVIAAVSIIIRRVLARF